MLHQYFFAWDSASAEFQRAVRLRDPDDSEPLVAYGRHLLFYGRIADGLEAFLTARQNRAGVGSGDELGGVRLLPPGKDGQRRRRKRAFI